MSSHEMLSRRKLVFRSAASSLVVPAFLPSKPLPQSRSLKLSGLPDSVVVFGENGSIPLKRAGSQWQGQDVQTHITQGADGFDVKLLAPGTAVLRMHLRWLIEPPMNLQYLGDHWERSYGDLAWRSMEPERVMPWYFLAFDGNSTVACGVRTDASAFCFWQVDPAGVSLWLDLRNGGRGVQLGKRELHAASVVSEFYPDTKPFAAARRFCQRLCKSPRLPSAPVYGGNNWYYAYGKSSATDIRDDSERMSSLAPSNENRPFMVIDDGWSPNATAGPWSHGNAKFPDMAQLASDMRRIGVQPGLWVRPLFTKEEIPAAWRLTSPNSAREYSTHRAYTIDPTVPEALESIRRDVRTAVSWGYRLIKHDFSTYDLLGRWGFNMGAAITDPDWSFADRTRTNAEIIGDLYRALREAAGDAMLLGCNTVGHIGAGLFELQRIGDDTSGRDWNRTRKMGVNTLAFRAPQHGTFFAVDADCVGLTKQIPWTLNRQWLDLLGRSGTPLFVSAAPDALGPEQRTAIRQAFTSASTPMPLLEPVDWLRNSEPQEWILRGQRATYHWFGAEGVSPFAG
jgi:alpha-galactosidase